MSRIGRTPVLIPPSVSVAITEGRVNAKGPLGEAVMALPGIIHAEIKDGRVLLTADLEARRDAKALYGMSRAMVQNMVLGVTQGFSKTLEIIGIGFRAEAGGDRVTFSLGKSHPVIFAIPKGIKIEVDAKRTQLKVSGVDKGLVGETAAKIRGLRPPEPYKGTGIRYQGEHVRRKAGKTAAGAGTGAKK